MEASTDRQSSGVLRDVFVFLLGMISSLYFIIIPITGSDLAYFPGDLGDARFNTYLLEHAHKYFSGDVKQFWDAPFMYPAKEVISISDNLLGTAPFYSMFRILGLDRETAFQFWFISMFILAFLCSFLFFRAAFKNSYAAILGAVVFTFSLAMQSQMTHAQVFPRFAIPLAFWASLLFVQQWKPWYFFAAVMTVVYQFYCGIYLGFLLCVPLGALYCWRIYRDWPVVREKLGRWSWTLKMLASVALGALAMAPLMLPYLRRAAEGSLHRYADVVHQVPTVTSHFFAQKGTLLWSGLQESGMHLPAFWNHQIFAGGIATLALIVLLYRALVKKVETDQLVVAMAVAAAVTFVCFLRIGNLSIYRLLHEVPGFGSMRALCRIINVELVFFGFAVAYFAEKLFNRYKQWSFLLFILALGILIADNYHKEGQAYRTSKEEAQYRVKLLARKMKYIEPGSIVSYEPEKREDSYNLYQIDAMLAAQQLGLRAVNGYSGDAPKGYGVYWQKMDSTSRNAWLDLNGLSRDSVVVVK